MCAARRGMPFANVDVCGANASVVHAARSSTARVARETL